MEIGLRVKKSSIQGAGLGLWATRDFGFKKNIMQLDYETINNAELQKRYNYKDEKGAQVVGIGPYAFSINNSKDTIGDAMCVRNTPSFANDKTKSRGAGYQGANAVLKNITSTVWLQTKGGTVAQNKPDSKAVAIKAGQEIFLAYGRGYWDDADKVGVKDRRVGVSKAKETKRGRVGQIHRVRAT